MRKAWLCRKDPVTGGACFITLSEGYDEAGSKVHIIEDTMEPLKHPITREMVNSKSEFARITKAHGCETVGGEQMRDRRDLSNKGIRQGIEAAAAELRSKWHESSYREQIRREQNALGLR